MVIRISIDRSKAVGVVIGGIVLIISSFASFACLTIASDNLQPATEIPTYPSEGAVLLKQELESSGVSSEVPQSSPNWRYPHTPFKVRLAFFLGDQAGGPVRFNTRFPEVKSDPHPASYFHALPMIGGELEYAMKWGGLLVGALIRRDVWHPGIKGRAIAIDNQTWTVDTFAVNSAAFVLGWVFGERYREAPWSSDIALVYDRGSADTTLTEVGGSTAIGQVGIDALTLRARLQFNLYGSNEINISAGPDFHLPAWQSLVDQSDENIKSWLANHIQLKSSASIGLSLMTNYRF